VIAAAGFEPVNLGTLVNTSTNCAAVRQTGAEVKKIGGRIRNNLFTNGLNKLECLSLANLSGQE
jgi:hypothetical protein